MPPERFRIWLGSFEGRLLAGALLLRLLYLSTILNGPYFDHPVTDEAMYDHWAWTLAGGGDFNPGYPYYDSPLHAYYLALIYVLFGHTLLAVRLVQVLLGTLHVLVLYRLARRLFDEPVAKVAGVLAATYLPFLYYEGLLLKESAAAFLLDASLLLMTGALSRATWPAYWSVGALLGLFALSRVNALLLIPAFLAVAWLSGHQGPRAVARAAVGLLLGVLMVVAPVTIRNRMVSGEWVLITVSGGQVLYTANNPANTSGDLAPVPFIRQTSLYERIDFHRQAEKETGRRMTPAEVSAYWGGKAVEFAAVHPLTQLRMVGHRFLRFWNRAELPDNHSIEQFKRFSWLLRLPLPGYWLIAPLGLLGLVLFCARWRSLSLLYLTLGVYLVSLLPFWVSSRYRMPIAGVLLLFTAATIVRLTRDAQRDGARAMAVPAAGLAAAAALCWFPMPQPAAANLERNLAYVYEQARRYDEAITIYERLRQVERNPENDLYLANALGLAGRLDEARSLLARLEAPSQPAEVRRQAFNFRGDLARRLQQWPEAEAAYRTALAIDPSDTGAWNNLAVALVFQRKFDEAQSALRTAIALSPEDPLAGSNLATLLDHLAREGRP
jgi:tetratricopeptide (TPR) repeat protein